jgi:hypothetical protein
MRRSLRWLPCAGLAVIALIVLFVAGSSRISIRTFALDAPSQYQVTVLHPFTHVCEGPVASQGPARGVGIWGGSIGGPATLTLDVRNARSGAILASGRIHAIAQENEWTTHLGHTISGAVPLRICLLDDAGVFTLSGSPAVHPKLVMTGTVVQQEFGKPHDQEFSLVLLDGDRSLFSSLPLAFSRAALWRPSWVGSWTFWVLAACLFGTFGLGVVAVASAASVDEEDRPPQPEDDVEPDLPPSPDLHAAKSSRTAAYNRLEPGQDRPQSVL